MTDEQRVLLCEMLNKPESDILFSFLEEKKEQSLNEMLNTDKPEQIFAEHSKAKTIKKLIVELSTIKEYKNITEKETEQNG